MLRFLSVCALALLAPALLADSIGFLVNKEIKTESNVEIKSWSWSKVEYIATVDKGDGKVEKVTKTAPRKDIVTLSRSSEGGSMSAELFRALSDLGNDPEAAINALENEAKNGTPLNKEEAKFRIAGYFASNANARNAKVAADRVRDYINSYKDGYFLGEAYTLLGRMCILGKDYDGARTTYKDMVRLGSPYDSKGHQARGELELLVVGNADAAVSAFRDASKAAGTDKALKAKADAYIAWALAAQSKWEEAKGIAEPITKDESIDDPNSVDDEAALGIAYFALAQALIEGGQTFEKGYDAAMLAAYYAWWVGGTTEGKALGLAYFAAKKLEGTDEKFKARAEKLRTALESGYPGVLRDIDAKLKK